VHDQADCGAGAVRVGQVVEERQRMASGLRYLVGQVLCLVFGAVVAEGDPCSLVGEDAGDGRADPAGGTGDQGHAIGQSEVHHAHSIRH
jgi:hypothetical protein